MSHVLYVYYLYVRTPYMYTYAICILFQPFLTCIERVALIRLSGSPRIRHDIEDNLFFL